MALLILNFALASSNIGSRDIGSSLATKRSFRTPICFPKEAGPYLVQSDCLATLNKFAFQCPDEECIFTSEESERGMHIIGQLFLRATFQSGDCYLILDMPKEIDTVARTESVRTATGAILAKCVGNENDNGGYTTFPSDDEDAWISAVITSRMPALQGNYGSNDTALKDMPSQGNTVTVDRKK